jgi:hypothetical protein
MIEMSQPMAGRFYIANEKRQTPGQPLFLIAAQQLSDRQPAGVLIAMQQHRHKQRGILLASQVNQGGSL